MGDELFDLNIDSISDDMVVDVSNIEVGDTTKDNTDKGKTGSVEDDIELIELDEATGGDFVADGTEDTKSKGKQTSPVFADTVNTFASALHEEGVLPSINPEEFAKLPAEEKTKALIEAVRTEMTTGLENWVDNLPPQLKKALMNYTEGVSLKDIIESDATETTFGSITEDKLAEDEDTRKKVIKQDLIMRGYTPAQAEKFAQRSIDLGEDLNDSKEALKSILVNETNKMESKKQEERARQKAFEESKRKQIEDIKTAIYNTQEIIPGVKLNKVMQDKVFKNMTTVVGEDGEGRPYNIIGEIRSKNPISFDTKLNYYAALGLFDEKPDFGKLTNNFKTQAVKKLENTFTSMGTKSSGSPFENDYTENQIASRILGKY